MNRFLLIVIMFLGFACKRETPQDFTVPNVPVNITINISLPEYLDLQIPGRWVYVDGGVRGIIVFHDFDGSFYAMDRNCSYKSQDSCATVSVEPTSNTFARCGSYNGTDFTPCCNSSFYLGGGTVSEGPAIYNLKPYNVSRNGQFIFIRN